MKKFDFSNVAIKAASVAGGVVVAKIADKPLQNMATGLRGGLKIIVGAILPEIMPSKGTKGVNMIDGIGSGIIAAGAADLYSAITSDEVKATEAVEGLGGDQFDEEYIQTEDLEEIEGVEGAEETLSGSDETESTLTGIGD